MRARGKFVWLLILMAQQEVNWKKSAKHEAARTMWKQTKDVLYQHGQIP